MSSLDEYNEMKRALRESEGARLHSDLLALRRSLRRVFHGNCDELLGFLSSTDDQLTAIRLWAVQNAEGFDRFLDEVDRLLHNVVAAAMSLREHSYRVRDKWLDFDPGDELREQYDERVSQVFAASETARLVHDLRRMIQHWRLPRLLGHAEQVRGGPFTSKIHHDRDDLLRWDGWNAAMRVSLKGREEPIVLDEIVIEYRDAVVGFHTWFGDALRQRNAQTLQDLERDRRELRTYASGLFGPPLSDPVSEEGDPLP